MEMKIIDRTPIASGGWISLQKVSYLGHDSKIWPLRFFRAK